MNTQNLTFLGSSDPRLRKAPLFSAYCRIIVFLKKDMGADVDK
jgi:hypothetical protein